MSQSLYRKPNGDIYLQLFNELHKIADNTTVTRLFGANPTISDNVPSFDTGFDIGTSSCLIRLENGLVGFCVQNSAGYKIHGFDSISAIDYYQFSHAWFPECDGDQLAIHILGTVISWGDSIKAT
ncbi:hypothetical protein PG911_11785 [Tenacibaculum ovolyticum]|jgi:hypothetical protein|uniref:hypothetical protein n=1 Tax=Tenacibaculum ovolyticum TaxID=104270 RepID=UPI0007EE1113|nr:hypothetical protein [Tenacibaculum ovolyticum]WBX75337.1 hypothetical protein PG911_11785 [Tenacibaculum ovolyticum]